MTDIIKDRPIEDDAEERQLMRLLIKDLMEEKLQKRAQDIAKKAQRAKNAKEKDKTGVVRKQAACLHIKGKGKRLPGQGIDFNLFKHIFISNKIVIGCLSCRMKWHPGDTMEFLIRNGKKVPNHTKWGWAEADEKFSSQATSNTPSSSERLVKVTYAPDEVEVEE